MTEVDDLGKNKSTQAKKNRRQTKDLAPCLRAVALITTKSMFLGREGRT